MSALYIGIIIIGFLLVLIGLTALISVIRRKRRSWSWYVVYVIGWVYAITGIVLYGLNPTQSHSELITRDASELVLTTNDFEAGWIQLKSEIVIKEGAETAYHVYFRKVIDILYLGPHVANVKNTVAVYPDINLAEKVYLGEKPTNVSLNYPKIGDGCFLNILNELLVFRKSNVVVWVQIESWYVNVEYYAKIIENRISRLESTSKVG